MGEFWKKGSKEVSSKHFIIVYPEYAVFIPQKYSSQSAMMIQKGITYHHLVVVTEDTTFGHWLDPRAITKYYIREHYTEIIFQGG